MKPAIIEATWDDRPTFLIALIDSDGIARKALWKLEGTEGAMRQGDKKVGPYELEALPDARAIWTNRIAWGWHSPDRRKAQKALDILNKILT